MIIIGIDPGMADTGFGVIESLDQPKYVSHGCIKTPVGEETPKRLLRLRKELHKVVADHKPKEMVIEQLFFNTNVKTAMLVGQARGVVMLVAAEFGIPVFEYTALQAKLHLTGYGRSEKSVVQEAVKTFLKIDFIPRPVHSSDALAIALCHIHKQKEI